MLLLHGGGVAGWMWDSLRARLEATHGVLVPDLPGHGSSADEPYRSHDATVEALVAMLRREKVGPVAVIGFSLGAQLAVQLAARHPEAVERVAVVSAQASPLPFAGPTLGLLALAAPLARSRRFARLQARELFVPPASMEAYLETSAGISRRTLLAAVGENLRFRVPEGWASYPGDALVMVGGRERAVMRESASILHAALPTSRLETVDGAGHGVPLQRSSWFDERVVAWLAETASTR